MKVPPVGWAFFALAVIVLLGYTLNRGIFIGSEVRKQSLTLNDGRRVPNYVKYCKYLHFTGVNRDSFIGEDDEDAAYEKLCRMFDE